MKMASHIPAVRLEQIVTVTGELVLQIAKVLVDKPDEVSLAIDIAGNAVNMTLFVAATDRMNVVGEQGIILMAVRTVLATVNRKTRHKFTLEVAARGQV